MATAALLMLSVKNLTPRSTWDKCEIAGPKISSV